MSEGRCDHCGDSLDTELEEKSRRVLCRDIPACCRRFFEAAMADRWYAEELERLRERAPA